MFIFGRKLTRIFYIYFWFRSNSNEIKNGTYEYFKSFDSVSETATCSLFANDIALSAYIKKVMKVTQDFFIKSVIINTSSTGKIQVLINVEK